ncbi:MAG UNVERIFIED_CONTAM: hypothetical protein LVR29_04955, partial [Microcystis novacekii LVE1205-3]
KPELVTRSHSFPRFLLFSSAFFRQEINSSATQNEAALFRPRLGTVIPPLSIYKVGLTQGNRTPAHVKLPLTHPTNTCVPAGQSRRRLRPKDETQRPLMLSY